MVYYFLANGFEEMEAICPIDILRRAGVTVVTVGIGEEVVTSSHGVSVCTDITEVDVYPDEKLEMIVLPGGMPGTLNLEHSKAVQSAIDYCVEHDIYIAAICAAPSILGHKNLLSGKEAICFPGYEEQLLNARISEKKVCVDGKIITAKGAGVSIEFGLKLAEILKGEAKAEKIAEALQCR